MVIVITTLTSCLEQKTEAIAEGESRFLIVDPGEQTAGSSVTIKIQALLPSGSVDTAFNSKVTLKTTGSATGAGLVTITAGEGSIKIENPVAEAITLSLVDSTGTGLDSTGTQEVVFSSAPETQFGILKPTDTAVTAAATVTIQAQDVNGNKVSTFNGRVTLQTTGSATIASDGVVTLTDGEGSITVTNAVAESVTLSLTDGSGGLSTSTTETLTFIPGDATSFSFSLSATTATAGQGVTVTIRARDTYNNLATGFQQDVSVAAAAISLVDGVGVVDIVNGLGTATIQYNRVNPSPQPVTVSLSDTQATGLTLPSSQTVTYSVGSATALIFRNVPDAQVGGVGTTVTINAVDEKQNVDTNYSGTATLATTGSAAISGGATVTITNGVGTKTLTNNVSERVTLSLSASSSGLNTSATKSASFYLLRIGGGSGDKFGYASSNKGDYNGDGTNDLVIGTPFSDVNGADSGQVRVFSGINFSLLALLPGESAGDRFGTSVDFAGDYNLNGIDDIVIGAPVRTSNTGKAYVYSFNAGDGLTSDTLVLGITGATAGDLFGSSVAGIGDTNNDGEPDIAISAPGYASSTGRVYVYTYASGDGNASDTLVATLTGSATGDQFGYDLSAAGDVNRDGYADLIIGAPYADGNGGADCGKAIIYSGASNTALTTKQGSLAAEHFGSSVDGLGDINGDGKSDFIVGAPDGGSSTQGMISIFSGSSSRGYPLLKSKTGSGTGDDFGFSVSTSGDYDRDGTPDYAVGAPLSDFSDLGNDVGEVFVYSGKTHTKLYSQRGEGANYKLGIHVTGGRDLFRDGRPELVSTASFEVSGTIDGRIYVYRTQGNSTKSGAKLVGSHSGTVTGSQLGASVAWAGDYNGDGTSDYIVGLPYDDANGLTDSGRIVVYSGVDGSTLFHKGGQVASGYFGYSLAGGGDYNGDGKDDIIVGSYGYSDTTNKGKVYVYGYNASDSTSSDTLLTSKLGAGTDQDRFGYAVAFIGDINSDGKEDFAVGAPYYQASAKKGRVYVYGASGTLATLTGGADGDEFGSSVAGVGDYDRDGDIEFIVGAPNENPGAGFYGEIHVYSYNAGAYTEIASINKSGEAALDRFGEKVAGIGDYDGDGSPDILVSAPNQDAGGTDRGKIYVYSYDAGANNTVTTKTGSANSDFFGSAISGIGDYDWDGLPEFAVGAYGVAAGVNTGRVYVYSFDAGVNTEVIAAGGVTLTGAAAADQFGFSLAGIGDYARNGFFDLLIGANLLDASTATTNTGKAYIYRGQ